MEWKISLLRKSNIFQARFGKLDVFGWWDLEGIQTNDATQFTSKESQAGLVICRVQLTLKEP